MVYLTKDFERPFIRDRDSFFPSFLFSPPPVLVSTFRSCRRCQVGGCVTGRSLRHVQVPLPFPSFLSTVDWTRPLSLFVFPLSTTLGGQGWGSPLSLLWTLVKFCFFSVRVTSTDGGGQGRLDRPTLCRGRTTLSGDPRLDVLSRGCREDPRLCRHLSSSVPTRLPFSYFLPSHVDQRDSCLYRKTTVEKVLGS